VLPPILFLPHEASLHAARLEQRRDRFLADVVLEATGEKVVAYCVNPGRMETFSRNGARIWLLPATASCSRRLLWTWELIEHDGVLCGANTQRPNTIARALLDQRLLPGLDDWVEMASERTAASVSGKSTGAHVSRFDFWLRSRQGEHFVEVKNCHLVYPDGHGYFPDSVSLRAGRHVRELASLVKTAGHRATVLFVVARGDFRGAVRPSDHHDPAFAEACREAAASGVKFRAVAVSCCLEGYRVERETPVDLGRYDVEPVATWVAEHRLHTGWIRSQTQTRVGNGPFPHEAKRCRVDGVAKKRDNGGSVPVIRHRTKWRRLKRRRAALVAVDIATGCAAVPLGASPFLCKLRPAKGLIEI
jgi:sugar fermentation stimulation protein A